MIYSKRASALVETLIAMLIIVTGIIGVYKIYTQSTKLSISTDNRIKAIAIAREGIEGVQNIRDTNWLLFGADTKNCWNTFNYNYSCIGDNAGVSKILTGSFIVYKNTDNRWYLLRQNTTGDFSSGAYRNTYEVKLDSDGLYTQSGGISSMNPIFTRQINVLYIDTNGDSIANQNDEKMLIKSTVSWKDSAILSGFHSITLENILTNRRND